jgi:hypothetical protein
MRIALLLLASLNALAAGRELAPPPVIAADPVTSRTCVAEAGGRFLTVWFESRGSLVDTALMGILTDGRGARIGPPFFIGAFKTWSSQAFDLVGTGDSFAVFQTSENGITRIIDIGLDGRVLRTRTLNLGPHVALRAAWDGTRFLAVMTRIETNTRLHSAALLSREGEVLKSGVPIQGTEIVREVVATPTRFLVLTADTRTFTAHDVTADGNVREMRIGKGGAQSVTAAALANGDVLIAWSSLSTWCTLRVSRWSNGMVSTEQTPYSGKDRVVPLRILRGAGRHLVAFVEREDKEHVLSTLFVGDDGTARSGVTKSGVSVVDDAFDAAASGTGLFVGYLSPRRNEGVFGVAVEPNGTVLAPTVLTLYPAGQHPPLLAAGGGSVLAAWTETTGSGTRIRAATLDTTLLPESDREVLPNGTLTGTDLPWNGSEYLALAQTPAGLVATRLAADGSPSAVPPALLWPDPEHVAVVWAGDRWVVVWSVGPWIWLATVTGNGAVSEPREFRLNSPPAPPTWSKAIRGLSLAFDGTHLHLTWIEARPLAGWGPVGTDVFTTRISAEGTLLDESAAAIPVGWLPQSVSSAANGDTLLVLVDELGRTTVSAIGKSRAVSTRTLFDWQAQSDIAWDGREFVAALRARGERWYISVFRLMRDGSPAAAPRGTMTLGAQDSGRVSVAATPMEAVLGLQETTPEGGPRAVVYSDREMPRLPDPPPPPRNVRLVHSAAGGYDVVWDDTAERYLVEQRAADGSVRVVALTSEPRLGYARGYVRIRAFDAGVPSASSDWIYSEEQPRRRAVRP